MNRGSSHSGSRGRSHLKPLDNSGHRSTIVCTFCNIHGHTVDKCYKKERADMMASKPASHPPSAMRSPSAYLTGETEKEVKAVHFDNAHHSAFMALAMDRTPTFPETDPSLLAEAVELPSLVSIQSFEFYFSDPPMRSDTWASAVAQACISSDPSCLGALLCRTLPLR